MKGFLDELRVINNIREFEFMEGAESQTPVEDLLFRSNEMGGEVGEAQNVVKKLVRTLKGMAGAIPMDEGLQKLADELGDVIICADRVAGFFDIDLEEATKAKFNKTSDKYGMKTKFEF